MEEDSSLEGAVRDVPDVAARYEAALERLARLAGASWNVKEGAARSAAGWRYFTPADVESPSQGWKIHVSCAVVEAPLLCERVASFVVGKRVAFKLPATLLGVRTINAGEAGATQLGKILTVYPRDAEQASELALELDELWPRSLGPRVPTDVTLRAGGAVGLRFGVISGQDVLVRANGAEEMALRLPDGSLVADERLANGAQPTWAPPLTVPVVQPAAPDALASLAARGRRVVPLVSLRSSARSKVTLGLDATGARRVILKVAARGVAGDERGRDMIDALRDERAVLAALPPGIGPAVYDLAEDDELAVMVLEDLGGTTLERVPAVAQREALPAVARLVAALHAHGIVHRDLKPTNIVYGDAGVRLIDFEHAARAGANDGRLGGTPGYMPPEGATGAAFAGDLYALGATIAGSYIGCDPSLVPGTPARLVGLVSMAGARAQAAIVRDLMKKDPSQRVSAASVAERLDACGSGHALEAGAPRATALARFAARASASAALATSKYRRPTGPFWHSEHETADSHGEALSNGASGILLGLASIEHAVAPQALRGLIDEGASWLAAKEVRPGVDGLWVGGAGVALTLAVLGRRLGRDDLLARAEERLRIAAMHAGETDMYSGSAGIAWAACLQASVLGHDGPLELAQGHARRVLSTLRLTDGVPSWAPSALVGEDAPVVGAAHGAAGTAIALAAWGRQCGQPAAEVVAAEIFRGLYRKARTDDGKALRRTLGGPATSNGEWCHGAAGYLWALLHTFGDDAALSEEIDWAVAAVDASPVVRSPTFCHGIAGRLELWQMVRDVPRHADLARRKADEAARVLRALQQRDDGHVVWGSERPHVITPSLWVGFLGPAAALARYAADRRDPLLSASWLETLARPAPRP